MPDARPQSYRSHARYVPGFHFALGAVVLATLLWSLWNLVRDLSGASVLGLLVALALAGLFWYTRMFPLTVQDRLIRLEMRLRLERVLPEELRDRIEELTPGQLVALRFASDGELPELVAEVLAGKLKGRQEIKRRVRDWQADHLRV